MILFEHQWYNGKQYVHIKIYNKGLKMTKVIIISVKNELGVLRRLNITAKNDKLNVSQEKGLVDSINEKLEQLGIISPRSVYRGNFTTEEFESSPFILNDEVIFSNNIFSDKEGCYAEDLEALLSEKCSSLSMGMR